MLRVKIKRFPHAEGLELPSYATPGSVGMDLLYAGHEEVVLKPFEKRLLPTGIAIELPEGYEAQVRPRSGLAIRHGITLLNTGHHRQRLQGGNKGHSHKLGRRRLCCSQGRAHCPVGDCPGGQGAVGRG
jgi:hypothetical protein